MSLQILLACLVAALLAIGGAALGGYRHGIDVAGARCKAAAVVAEEAAEVVRETRRLDARSADEQYALQRREQEARRAHALPKVEKALTAPISCPPGGLGDVRIPADALGGLRAAAGQAADPGGGSASAPPVRAVRRGAGNPGR
jgi:hypothetical protein